LEERDNVRIGKMFQMSNKINIVEGQRMALTKTKLDQLHMLVEAGDRAGFFVASYGDSALIQPP